MKGMQRARVREIERSTVIQVISREEEYYTISIRVERSRTGVGGGGDRVAEKSIHCNYDD